MTLLVEPSDFVFGSKSHRQTVILRFIQKMGLTDKLVEVRANCVKELLGILDESQLVRNKSDFSASGPGSETVESALTDFSFLNSEECDSANATKLSQLGVTPTEVEPSSAPSTEESDDVEIACALAEFDLLVAQQSECAGVVGSSVGSLDSLSYPVDINPHSIADPEWIFGDQSALVDRLTEKYRMCMPFPRSGGARVKKADKDENSTPSPAYDEVEFYDTAATAADGHQPPPPPSCYLDTPAQPPSSSSIPGAYGDDFDVEETVATVRMLEKAAQATDDSAAATTFSLGDLASLTVANEADTQRRASALDNLDGVGPVASTLLSRDGEQQEAVGADGSTTAAASRSAVPAWTAKYTLRSHFDSIRAILFHHTEQILLTAGEDHTLKLWNLAKTVQAKKSSCLDVEPMYTCRGHNSPVLCIALTSFSETVASASGAASPPPSPGCESSASSLENNCAFSGSLNGEIRSWRFGDLQLLPYEAFDAGVNGPILRGHTDAVWSLAARADGVLLSASADGTVRLWNIPPSLQQSAFGTGNTSAATLPPTSLAANRVYRPAALLPPSAAAAAASLPTSVTFLSTDADSFAVGLTTGEVCVISLESGRLLTLFESHQSAMPNTCDDSPPAFAGPVNSLVSHPTLPLLISAHENRQIRFLNTSLGRCVHSMVAHLDAVTSIAVDAQGSYLLSASHDCSIRLWDIETKTCVQELTSHRKKFDESIHCVAFHPTRPLMASAGADGLAKVFV
ncbi:hypothetical protein AAHC03_026184 [Spirometra sp. Aus1]